MFKGDQGELGRGELGHRYYIHEADTCNAIYIYLFTDIQDLMLV